MSRKQLTDHALFQALEGRALFSTTFMVTTAADSGPGSLRQAILDANNSPGHDEIHFNIGAGGAATITPLTQLTRIDDAVTIDGTTQPGYGGKPIIEINGASTTNADGILIFFGGHSTLKGLVINRFDGWGIRDVSTGFNTIQNCHIGTNVAGNADLGNGTGGISLFSRGNLVGGPDASQRNVVSGNGSTSNFIGPGIQTTEAGGGNVIQGNFVGVAADGLTALGNSAVGVFVSDHGSTVTGNVIAFNGSAGVSFGPNSKDNFITQNSIFNNVGIGIDLRNPQSAAPDGPTPNDTLDVDSGSNNLQNAPVIASAQAIVGKTTVKGSLSTEKNKVYRIELFNNPVGDTQGEGKTFLKALDVTTDTNGKASFSVDLPGISKGVITATATDPDNNTSEFSNRKGITVSPISGTVFNDLDADGVKDSNEAGIANWRVWLDKDNDGVLDKNETSVLTDSAGKYKFSSLVAGKYNVRAESQAGWRQTAPGKLFHARTLPGSDHDKPCDFGFTNSALIKGNVFFDRNNNGKQEAGEGAIAGVRVFLDADNDGVWDANERSRITTSTGAYRFAGIKKGTYAVRVENAPDTTVSLPQAGFYSVKLNPGQAVTRNFGIFSELPVIE